MSPSERRDAGKKFGGDLENGLAELQLVPADNARGQQVEASDPALLSFLSSVAAKPPEYGTDIFVYGDQSRGKDQHDQGRDGKPEHNRDRHRDQELGLKAVLEQERRQDRRSWSGRAAAPGAVVHLPEHRVQVQA